MLKKKNKKKSVLFELKKIKSLERLSDKELYLIESFLVNLSEICYQICAYEKK